MPANIAHLLIANTAYDSIRTRHPDVADEILNKNNFFYLGALGPDLPSYKTSELVRGALSHLLLRPFVAELNPREQDASFFLHSIHPHLFPYFLMETNHTFCEIRRGRIVPNEFNRAVFVFALGYVTHIAADQVVHQLVRELVGPYYRSITTSQQHSDCEVHQDVFLFRTLFPDREYRRTIQSDQIDISREPFADDYDSFCNLLSLSLSKAGYGIITRSDIDGWLDGIQLTFRLMHELGPYVKVMEEVGAMRDPESHPQYHRYFHGDTFNYMRYFHAAVELACTYIDAVNALWAAPDFSHALFERWCRAVQPHDLTSPFFTLPAA